MYLRPRHDTNNLSELLSFNFGLVEVNCYKFRGEFCCQTVVVLAELPDLSARNRKETVSTFFSRSHANHPSLRQQQHPFKSFHVQGCHYHFFSRSYVPPQLLAKFNNQLWTLRFQTHHPNIRATTYFIDVGAHHPTLKTPV